MLSVGKIRRNIIAFIVIVFIALESGSMFQMIYASEINRLNFLILMILAVLMLVKRRSRTFVIRSNMENLFLIIIIAASLIDIIYWTEFNYYVLYGANIASFIICYFLSKNIPYLTWKRIFINAIFILAMISLIGWSFSTILATASFGFDLEGTWQYKSFVVFNIIKSIPLRNCGIFWEPGMYQGFLNFGILLILMQKKKSILDMIKAVVLALTVLTTFSTTGYIILLVLVIYAAYKLLARAHSTIATLFLIVAAFIFIGTDGFSSLFSWAQNSLPSILTKKIVNENASFTTRIYSALFDVMLGIKYPTGVGRASVSEMVKNLARTYNVTVTARTSTLATAFVYYGILGGLVYAYLWIRGAYRCSEKKLTEFMFVLLIMFLILNNEPMLFHLFFGTIMFYWNQNSMSENAISNIGGKG